MDKKIDKNQLRTTIIGIFIGILKKKAKGNFVGIEHDIRQVNPEGRFSTLEVREILWELLTQGVLAPGMDSPNPDFPWFHVTEYGVKCLESDDILPHDPDNYLMRLGAKAGQELD